LVFVDSGIASSVPGTMDYCQSLKRRTSMFSQYVLFRAVTENLCCVLQ